MRNFTSTCKLISVQILRNKRSHKQTVLKTITDSQCLLITEVNNKVFESTGSFTCATSTLFLLLRKILLWEEKDKIFSHRQANSFTLTFHIRTYFHFINPKLNRHPHFADTNFTMNLPRWQTRLKKKKRSFGWLFSWSCHWRKTLLPHGRLIFRLTFTRIDSLSIHFRHFFLSWR